MQLRPERQGVTHSFLGIIAVVINGNDGVGHPIGKQVFPHFIAFIKPLLTQATAHEYAPNTALAVQRQPTRQALPEPLRQGAVFIYLIAKNNPDIGALVVIVQAVERTK